MAPQTQEDASPVGPLEKWLRRAVFILSLGYIGCFLVVAGLRISYPFQLEWMEGGTLEHVRMILDGRPVYSSPDLEFIPFIYTPLLYFLGAVCSFVVGNTFLALRFVSFAATLGTMVCLYLFVRKETGSSFWGLLAPGLYAGSFELCGGWFDVARSDSLFLCLLLWSSYCLRFQKSFAGRTVAGFLLFLSFFSKQTGLVAGLPFLAYEMVRDPKRTWGAVLALGGSLLVSNLWMDAWTNGWYSYYCWELPGHHRWAWPMLFTFFTKDTVVPLTVAAGLGLYHLVWMFPVSWRDQRWHLPLLCLGLLGVSLGSRLHFGGYVNVLMPVYAGCAIGFGLGGQHIMGALEGLEREKRRRIASWVLVLSVVQFVSLAYKPWDHLPSKKDREAGERLVSLIAGVKGDVFCPGNGYLAVQAGKRSSVHQMAAQDLLRGSRDEVSRIMIGQLRQALATRKYDGVVLGTNWFEDPRIAFFFKDVLETHYETDVRLFEDAQVFWPVTGWRTRPEVLCRPR